MKTLCFLLFAGAFCSAYASGQQGSSDLSNASELVAEGSAMTVNGSMAMLAGSAQVVVASVETAGSASVVVLQGASEGARASVQLSGQAAHGASIAVGTAVSVLAVSAGHVLIVAGKVIAFIPNELGKALLHHSPVRDQGNAG